VTASARRVTLVHGFLGSTEDWDGVVQALGAEIDADRVALAELGCESVEAAAHALAGRVTARGAHVLVGYSLGGRIALAAMAHLPAGMPLVLLSTGPGVEDDAQRAARAAEDDARAAAIRRAGLASFVETWYRMPMFAALRASPGFERVQARRASGDGEFWAKCVAGCSPGRSAPRWDLLGRLAPGSAFAVGIEDDRYASNADRAERTAPSLRIDRIAGAGHALPIEAPAACAAIVEHALRTRP
jgi:2-succinyl-6-hydroxy-2,4-cyclohexadiene-1-carboxylate synthase